MLAIGCVLLIGRCWFGVECCLLFVVVCSVNAVSCFACALCVGAVDVRRCVSVIVCCVLFVVSGLLFVVVWLLSNVA